MNTPVRLMSIISLHCCSVISQTTAQSPMPAFAQTMSIFPSSARPVSTAACISDSERTSATALTARRPVACTCVTVSSRSSSLASA